MAGHSCKNHFRDLSLLDLGFCQNANKEKLFEKYQKFQHKTYINKLIIIHILGKLANRDTIHLSDR